MTSDKKSFLHHYAGILWLLCGILTGSLFGIFFKDLVPWIKPIGDIYINLLFTAVIPLVFFTIASVIANLGPSLQAGKLIGTMTLVFLATVLLASLITLLALHLVPISPAVSIPGINDAAQHPPVGDQIVQLLTVNDFGELLSRKSMLALIIFSLLIGVATRLAGSSGVAFKGFLLSGNAVIKQLLQIIMLLSPIGLGAYFAYQVATIGPQLFGAYAQTLAVAHGVSFFYYFFIFSAYALLAGGRQVAVRYWKYNIKPSITALATCSSIATIPANLEAAEKMGISERVSDFVVPLGATLHKEGSAIAAVVKVAVALALSHKSILDLDAGILALLIAALVSIIEGGIPNGGYIGELLIVSAYHLPAGALPVMMILGTLLDPIATLLNATGDTVSGLLTEKLLRPKKRPL